MNRKHESSSLIATNFFKQNYASLDNDLEMNLVFTIRDMGNLTKLSDDVIEYITSFLTLEDIASLNDTCKRLQRITYSIPFITFATNVNPQNPDESIITSNTTTYANLARVLKPVGNKIKYCENQIKEIEIIEEEIKKLNRQKKNMVEILDDIQLGLVLAVMLQGTTASAVIGGFLAYQYDSNDLYFVGSIAVLFAVIGCVLSIAPARLLVYGMAKIESSIETTAENKIDILNQKIIQKPKKLDLQDTIKNLKLYFAPNKVMRAINTEKKTEISSNSIANK